MIAPGAVGCKPVLGIRSRCIVLRFLLPPFPDDTNHEIAILNYIGLLERTGPGLLGRCV